MKYLVRSLLSTTQHFNQNQSQFKNLVSSSFFQISFSQAVILLVAAVHAAPEAEAEADADAYYGYYGYGARAYGGYGYGLGYGRAYGYGYPRAYGYYGKRSADAEAEPEAEAEADAAVLYGAYGYPYGLGAYGYGAFGYAGYPYGLTYGAGVAATNNVLGHAVAYTAGGVTHSSNVGVCTNYLGAQVPC